MFFIETSALTGSNVKNAFMQATHQILDSIKKNQIDLTNDVFLLLLL
jgi:hypothetical protein